ncbi:hypothetical protein RJ55_04803 [Drechmeria coniospora]|nr:hypothetical protein RJ55_04803 [Drechmeria coniospora]
MEPENVIDQDVDVLEHKIGYKQELRRSFSALQSFSLSFGMIGLVPSISATVGFGLYASPASLVWCWPVGLLFITLIAISLGELASSLPTSGGLYFWTHHFAPESIRNPLCFFVGYANTLGNLAGFISAEYTVATMIASVASMANDGAWSPSRGELYAITLAVVVSHALLCGSRTDPLAKLQIFYSIGNLVIILALVVALPAVTPAANRNSAAWVFGHVENASPGWPTSFSFMLGFLVPLWSVTGWEATLHISEETAGATRAVPRALLTVCLTTLVLGWVTILAICFCMDPDVSRIIGSPRPPMAQILLDSFGKTGALVTWSSIMVLTWCMGSSCLIATSRQVWAFSRDGAFPLSTYIARVSSSGVPRYAVWSTCFVAAVMGLICIVNEAATVALFSLLIAGCYTAYCIPVVCRLVFGQHKFTPGPFYTGPTLSRVIGWTAVAFEVVMFVVFMFPIKGPNPSAAEMNYASVIFVAMTLAVVVYWYLPVVGAKLWFHGPKNNFNREPRDEEPVVSECESPVSKSAVDV